MDEELYCYWCNNTIEECDCCEEYDDEVYEDYGFDYYSQFFDLDDPSMYGYEGDGH